MNKICEKHHISKNAILKINGEKIKPTPGKVNWSNGNIYNDSFKPKVLIDVPKLVDNKYENKRDPYKSSKKIWTLVKLKNNKYHVVSPDGKIIKIDEVYTEED